MNTLRKIWKFSIEDEHLHGVDISGWGCYVFRMSAPAAERFTCDWIFKILVVLCDGKVVCGCADPIRGKAAGSLSPTLASAKSGTPRRSGKSGKDSTADIRLSVSPAG